MNFWARFRRELAVIHPWWILGAAWLIVILFAYPGQVTFDSWKLLLQARSGDYSDASPAAVPALWHALEYVVGGPFGMLLVQTLSLLSGLYLVFQRVFSRRGAAWAALGVFVFPPVMIVMAAIWKDGLAAGFLMLGIGCLLAKPRWMQWSGIASLALASCFRFDVPTATFPAIVMLFDLRARSSRFARYASALSIWLVVTLVSIGVNRALADREMAPWTTTTAVHDIAGTLAFMPTEIPDTELARTLSGTGLLVDQAVHDRARMLYTPKTYLPIVRDPRLAMWDLSVLGNDPPSDEHVDALRASWWMLVHTHPLAYLKHRVSVFREVLTSRNAVVPRDVSDREYWITKGLSPHVSGFQLNYTSVLTRLDHSTPLYRPTIYFVVALVLVVLARRQRDVMAILASGIVNELSEFLLASGTDYRYSHWLITCACVAVVMLIVRRRQGVR